MTEAPELTDKLDATTTVAVNGPEDATLDWHQIDWRRAEVDVRRLRQRIFTASQAGDLTRVRGLPEAILSFRANTLRACARDGARRRRLTAGVDGEMVLTPEAEMRLAKGSGARPSRSRPCRSDGCTSRSQEAPGGARSESP